jgi:hypothetical protein
MDAKEHCLGADLYERIRTYDFCERDILAFLILLRPHSAGSAVRDLSDFVAHRERDRGLLKDYVHRVLNYAEAAVDNKRAAQVQVGAVHSATEFHDSLNATLARFDLSPLDLHVTNDVLACIMSLLQEVRLIHNGVEIGAFQVGRFKKELWLLGAIRMPGPKKVPIVFPALIVPNTYCSSGEENKVGEFSDIVEAKCVNGRLKLFVGGKEAV